MTYSPKDLEEPFGCLPTSSLVIQVSTSNCVCVVYYIMTNQLDMNVFDHVLLEIYINTLYISGCLYKYNEAHKSMT